MKPKKILTKKEVIEDIKLAIEHYEDGQCITIDDYIQCLDEFVYVCKETLKYLRTKEAGVQP